MEEFFQARHGRAGVFSFTDPWTGVVHPRCALGADEFTITVTGPDIGAATLIIREVGGE